MSWLFSFDASMVMPFLACLVLIGMLVYLGIHVVSRKVVFVDLCLAQIAALGAIAGALLGRYDPDRDVTAIYLYSLAFTLFGAFLLSITKPRREKVPHEAIIGIIYVVAFATTLLALSKSGLGDQQIKSILEGHILYVESRTVLTTFFIFLGLGLFHFVLRKTFLKISLDPEGAAAQGVRVALWDFVFYAAFGIAVTSAVRIAGIFLVFTYLIVPAVAAMLFARGLLARLLTGWIGAAVVSFYGIKLAFVERLNLPISPSIVCLFAVALLVAFAVQSIVSRRAEGGSLRRLAVTALVVALFVGGIFLFRKERIEGIDKTLTMLADSQNGTRQGALKELLNLLFPDPGDLPSDRPPNATEGRDDETAQLYLERQDLWVPAVVGALSDPDREVRLLALDLIEELHPGEAIAPTTQLLEDRDDMVRERAIEVLRVFHDPTCNEALIQAFHNEHEPDLMALILDTLLEAGEKRAVDLSLDLLTKTTDLPELVRQDLYEHLQAHVAFKFTSGQIDAIESWWKTNRATVVWDPATKTFRKR